MRTVILTGATGFIGRHLHRALVADGWRVRPVVRDANDPRLVVPARRSPVIEVPDLFRASPSGLCRHFEGADAIVHGAWYVDHQNYMTSSLNWDAATASGYIARSAIEAGVRHYVGLGTCLEYAPSARPLHVASPCRPSSTYARAKYAAFLQTAELCARAGIGFAWARIFFAYGPGEPQTKLSSHLRRELGQGRRVRLLAATARRDFVHVTTVAEQIARALRCAWVGPFNVCSGSAQTVGQFAASIAEQMGRSDLLSLGQPAAQHAPASCGEPSQPPVIEGFPTRVYSAPQKAPW